MKPLHDHKNLRGLLIILLVGFASLFMLRQDPSGLLRFIQKYQHLSMVISLSLYTLLGATLIPSEPLTIFLIKIYGPFLAMTVATLGNTFAAFLEFFIGENIGDLAEFKKRKARLPFHLGDLPVQSPLFILLTRMLPGFGSKFVSLACGIYRVPLSTYVWTTFVSNLIGAAMLVASGYGLLKLM